MTRYQFDSEIPASRIVVEDVDAIEPYIVEQLANVFSLSAYDGLDRLGHKFASDISHIRFARDFMGRAVKDPKNIIVTSRDGQDNVTGFAIARQTSQDAFSLVAIGVQPDLRCKPHVQTEQPQIGAQLYHRLIKSISGQGGSRLDIVTPSATGFFNKVGAEHAGTIPAMKYRFEDLSPYPEEVKNGVEVTRYRQSIEAFRGRSVA